MTYKYSNWVFVCAVSSMEVVALLLLFAYANAYVIETIGAPRITVLESPCGCAPAIANCGCRAIEPSCGYAPVIDYGFRAIESPCGCGPIIDYGLRTIESPYAYAPVIDYGYRTIESPCGCAPVIDYGFRTIDSLCGCGSVLDYGLFMEPACGSAPALSSCGCRAIEPVCGCAPAIDYGLRTVESLYGYAPIIDSLGYRTVEACGCPVNSCLCQGPFSAVLDSGLAFPLLDYPRIRPGLALTDCVGIPPLPPVIGCQKCLRQITVPPPFL